MTFYKRRYYPIQEAASILGCKPEDLIHFAAFGEIKLGVLVHIDANHPEDYIWVPEWALDDGNGSNAIEDWEGFAYVNRSYFKKCEREGGLVFDEFEMTNGDLVLLVPPKIESRYVDEIYMAVTDIDHQQKRFGTSDLSSFPMASSLRPHPLNTREILKLGWIFNAYTDEKLKKAMSNLNDAKWLQAACVQRGNKSGGVPAMWDPILVAVSMIDRGYLTRHQANKVFQNELPEFEELWEQYNSDRDHFLE